MGWSSRNAILDMPNTFESNVPLLDEFQAHQNVEIAVCCLALHPELLHLNVIQFNYHAPFIWLTCQELIEGEDARELLADSGS